MDVHAEFVASWVKSSALQAAISEPATSFT
jgi:hypothetical protein